MLDSVVLILDSTVRLSVPLLLAGLAGLYSERAGVFDIGLEGKMLAAAFIAASAAAVSGSALVGLAGGILVSVALAALHGFASITHRGNQIVSGVAINFLALGLTALVGRGWFQQGGRTPTLEGAARFGDIHLPFAEAVSHIAVIGPLYSQLLSGHNALVYLAFLCVPLTGVVLYKTRFGLRVRAVGENPAAVDTAGISVGFLRYRALLCCGVLCGIAGSYLSIAQSASFVTGMTAGKGFIALAALIFANWQPGRLLLTCLLFGCLDALAIRLQGQEVPFVGEIAVQAFQAFPYALTVILLAGFIGKSTPPRAGGVAYVKERQ